MRLYEFIVEAVSISHLSDSVRTAAETGIKRAIGNLYELKGENPEAEERFNNEYPIDLENYLIKNLKQSIGNQIVKAVFPVLNKELGKNAVSSISFGDTGPAYGQADGSQIVLTEKFINSLARRSVRETSDIVLDNYDAGNLTSGLWFVISSIARDDKTYTNNLFIEPTESLSLLISTIVHEAVHIVQHKKQDERGFHDHEYRSYLDKTKGEFRGVHNKYWDAQDSKTKVTPDEESLYNRLYMASPQEMASFSHEIVLQIIKDFKLSSVRSIEDLNDIVSIIEATDIIDAVNKKVSPYYDYRNSDNKREYAVFKRYVKLVYQELQQYIARLRDRLSKTKKLNERAIGKKMGNDLYVHRDYVDSTSIPQDEYKMAVSKLPNGYEYTAVKYNSKDNSFSFIQSPDFDTADEPTVGVSLKVSSDGNVKRTNPPSDPWIWHNKWMWVGDDYTGFDVEKAKERSKKWKDYIGVNRDVSSRIGKKSYWDRNIVPHLKK